MKILAITPYFYPEGSGLENYAFQIYKELVKNGHQVTGISLSKKNLLEKVEGLKVIRKKYGFVVSNTPVRLRLLFDILRILKTQEFDLIHAHTPVPYAADMAALASKIKKIPLIITYHASSLTKGMPIIDLIAKAYQFFEYFTLRRAAKIVAVASNTKEGILGKWKSKTEVITPGVDLKTYYRLHNSSRVKNKILFAGSLEKSAHWKGVDVLLKAVSEVKKESEDIKLNIAGAGSSIEHYQKMARELNIENNVFFLGRLDSHKLCIEYQTSMAVIVPTINEAEGCPTVMFEAGACGTPIVASRIAGIPDIIKDGFNGLLVNPNDPVELKDAIIRILKDERLGQTLGNNGYKLVKGKYTWDKIADKYAQLYKFVLAEKV